MQLNLKVTKIFWSVWTFKISNTWLTVIFDRTELSVRLYSSYRHFFSCSLIQTKKFPFGSKLRLWSQPRAELPAHVPRRKCTTRQSVVVAAATAPSLSVSLLLSPHLASAHAYVPLGFKNGALYFCAPRGRRLRGEENERKKDLGGVRVWYGWRAIKRGAGRSRFCR